MKIGDLVKHTRWVHPAHSFGIIVEHVNDSSGRPRVKVFCSGAPRSNDIIWWCAEHVRVINYENR